MKYIKSKKFGMVKVTDEEYQKHLEKLHNEYLENDCDECDEDVPCKECEESNLKKSYKKNGKKITTDKNE